MKPVFQHESARYEGDGDPGCVGSCKACYVEALEKRVSPELPRSGDIYDGLLQLINWCSAQSSDLDRMFRVAFVAYTKGLEHGQQDLVKLKLAIKEFLVAIQDNLNNEERFSIETVRAGLFEMAGKAMATLED